MRRIDIAAVMALLGGMSVSSVAWAEPFDPFRNPAAKVVYEGRMPKASVEEFFTGRTYPARDFAVSADIPETRLFRISSR